MWSLITLLLITFGAFTTVCNAVESDCADLTSGGVFRGEYTFADCVIVGADSAIESDAADSAIELTLRNVSWTGGSVTLPARNVRLRVEDSNFTDMTGDVLVFRGPNVSNASLSGEMVHVINARGSVCSARGEAFHGVTIFLEDCDLEAVHQSDFGIGSIVLEGDAQLKVVDRVVVNVARSKLVASGIGGISCVGLATEFTASAAELLLSAVSLGSVDSSIEVGGESSLAGVGVAVKSAQSVQVTSAALSFYLQGSRVKVNGGSASMISLAGVAVLCTDPNCETTHLAADAAFHVSAAHLTAEAPSPPTVVMTLAAFDARADGGPSMIVSNVSYVVCDTLATASEIILDIAAKRKHLGGYHDAFASVANVSVLVVGSTFTAPLANSRCLMALPNATHNGTVPSALRNSVLDCSGLPTTDTVAAQMLFVTNTTGPSGNVFAPPGANTKIGDGPVSNGRCPLSTLTPTASTTHSQSSTRTESRTPSRSPSMTRSFTSSQSSSHPTGSATSTQTHTASDSHTAATATHTCTTGTASAGTVSSSVSIATDTQTLTRSRTTTKTLSVSLLSSVTATRSLSRSASMSWSVSRSETLSGSASSTRTGTSSPSVSSTQTLPLPPSRQIRRNTFISDEAEHAIDIAAVSMSGLASVQSPSTGFSMAQLSAVKAFAVCEFAHTESLPPMVNLLQLEFGAAHGKAYRGAVVGNVALCAAVVTALLLVAAAVAGVRLMASGGHFRSYRQALQRTLSDVHFPSILLIPVCVGFQGTVSASTSILLHNIDRSDLGYGVVGVTLCLLLLLFVADITLRQLGQHCTLQPRPPSADEKETAAAEDGAGGGDDDTETPEGPERLARLFKFLFFASAKWVPRNAEHAPWKARFYFLFAECRVAPFLLVEMMIAFVVGVAEGVRISRSEVCLALILLPFVGNIVILVLVLRKDAMLVRTNKAFITAINAVSAAICVWTILEMVVTSNFTATVVLVEISFVLAMAKMMIDLMMLLWWGVQHRSDLSTFMRLGRYFTLENAPLLEEELLRITDRGDTLQPQVELASEKPEDAGEEGEEEGWEEGTAQPTQAGRATAAAQRNRHCSFLDGNWEDVLEGEQLPATPQPPRMYKPELTSNEEPIDAALYLPAGHDLDDPSNRAIDDELSRRRQELAARQQRQLGGFGVLGGALGEDPDGADDVDLLLLM